MTWRELLQQLKDMEKVKHTCMDKPVPMIVDGIQYGIDLHESLRTGLVYIVPEMADEEEDTDAE